MTISHSDPFIEVLLNADPELCPVCGLPVGIFDLSKPVSPIGLMVRGEDRTLHESCFETVMKADGVD